MYYNNIGVGKVVMKNYYKQLDIIRIFSCIVILLYHLNLLKGGYLAVCTFFVLSGYLSVVTAFKQDEFSLKKYYINIIKKIYLPLIVVTFISVAVISLTTNFNWINLKPEVTSIIFGYNNFWQLNANLDYFVRNVSTPFMHFWYISLLLQVEILFPFVFMILSKLGKKISKIVPCLLLIILGVISCIFFNDNITNNHIMHAYYGTFSRLFSLVFGMFLGFFHVYCKPLVFKNNILKRLIFNTYLIIITVLFFIVDPKSILWKSGMFIATFISLRLIDYAIVFPKKEEKRNKLLSLSNICYEIYLVQYPVIFLIQDYNINNILKVVLIILITIVISGLIYFSLNNINKSKFKILKIVLLIPITGLTIYGLYTYIIAKDYTNDMNKLKNDLEENRALIEKKQKERLLKQKEEEEKWQEYLNSTELNEQDLENKVRNLSVIGIGDSIMELAVKDLYKEFPNGYFDAATNRTEKNAMNVIKDLKSKGIDSDVYILNIGTNGYCNEDCKEELIQVIGEDKYIFWLNTTNPDYKVFNTMLESVASKYDNVFIIDWRSYGLAHQEYLIYDKVHPNVKGCGIYAHKIYEGVYEQYLKMYNEARDKKIKEHEELEKNKITFIGNDLLRGIYDLIDNNYQNSKLLVDDYNYETIKELLSDDSISNNIVLVFDNNIGISYNQYQELIKNNENKNIKVITTDENIKTNNENIYYFNTNNKKSLDDIHLNDEGNNELFNLIKEIIE